MGSFVEFLWVVSITILTDARLALPLLGTNMDSRLHPHSLTPERNSLNFPE